MVQIVMPAAALRELTVSVFEFVSMFDSPNLPPYHDARHCPAAGT
jgi:hypothetical protein